MEEQTYKSKSHNNDEDYSFPVYYGFEPSFTINDQDNSISLESKETNKKTKVFFPCRIAFVELIGENQLLVVLANGTEQLVDARTMCTEDGIAAWGFAASCPDLGILPSEYPAVEEKRLLFFANMFGMVFFEKLCLIKSNAEITSLLNSVDLDSIQFLLNHGVFSSCIERMLFEAASPLTVQKDVLEKAMREKYGLLSAVFILNYRNPLLLAEMQNSQRKKHRFEHDEEAVRFAIKNNLALRIDNPGADSKNKYLTVDPTRIVSDGVRSYVIAYCRAKHKWSAIPLLKMTGILILDEERRKNEEEKRLLVRMKYDRKGFISEKPVIRKSILGQKTE